MIQISAQFQEAEQIVLDLHRLIALGQGDSDCAHELRNQGTNILEELPEGEVEEIQRLSAELPMLYGTESPRKSRRASVKKPHPPRKQFFRSGNAHGPRQVLVDALQKQDWPEVLNLLREEPLVEPWTRAYLRGCAYSALHRHRTAATFFAFAVGALQRVTKPPISSRRSMGWDRAFEHAVNAQMWSHDASQIADYRFTKPRHKNTHETHHHARSR